MNRVFGAIEENIRFRNMKRIYQRARENKVLKKGKKKREITAYYCPPIVTHNL